MHKIVKDDLLKMISQAAGDPEMLDKVKAASEKLASGVMRDAALIIEKFVVRETPDLNVQERIVVVASTLTKIGIYGYQMVYPDFGETLKRAHDKDLVELTLQTLNEKK